MMSDFRGGGGSEIDPKNQTLEGKNRTLGGTYLRGPESASIEIPSFRPHFIKFSKTVFMK